MSLAIKIKNRTAWVIRKTKKQSKRVYDHFFGVEGKNAQTNILPDPIYLKKLYKAKMGKDLDLNHPRSFNEKLQWMKLYDRNPLYTTLADKYTAKKYIASIIGDKYIIPTIAVFDNPEEIDFSTLPNQFVLKTTHDSGGVIVCKDKKCFDYDKAKTFLQQRLNQNYYRTSREWPYKKIRPRIIAEEYIQSDSIYGITDYKYFCFNGEPKLLYISIGLDNHPTAKISFYDLLGNEMPFHRSDYEPYHNASMPDKSKELIELSHRIATHIGSPFVRVDFYAERGKIYFSEITFFPCAGFLPFDPEEWDLKLGEWITLSQKIE